MTFLYNFTVVAATAIVYFTLCEANLFLFSALNFSAGVDWIFLPSGLRLAFVLIFGLWGALGIVAGSLVFELFRLTEFSTLTALGAALVSGFAPLLARSICLDLLQLDVDLRNLSGSVLLKVTLVFALLSPVLHQLWFSFQGLSDNFVLHTGVMVVGDLTGSLMMLYVAKYLLIYFTHLAHDGVQDDR